MQYPILDNNGRDIIGYANSSKTAKRKLEKLLTITRGFTLKVWHRDPIMAEINGGLIGFMYSIGK